MNIKQFFSKLYFWFLPSFFIFMKARTEKREWWVYNYLKNKISWKDKYWDELKIPSQLPKNVQINKTIFVYWKQGFENAPELVKRCSASLNKYKGDYSIVYLTAENVSEYISIPNFVIEKHDKGLIKEAFFSDLLRVNLLYRFGGIWVDATCFLSGNIPTIVKESDMFLFKTVSLRQLTPIVGSSWFLKANQGNIVLNKVQNYLFEWIYKHDTIPNYFMLHMVLSILVTEDDDCKKIFDKIPYYNNMSPHTFFFNWKSDYSESYYNFLLDSCFVHKLTYKYDPSLLDCRPKNMLKHFMDSTSNLF